MLPASRFKLNCTSAVVPVSVRPPASPVAAEVSCPACAPKLPSSRFWLPNEVVLAIRSISSRSCTISFCAAVRAVESDDAVLADWTIRSWMRCSIELTWVSAPSAVCTTEMPSWAFCVATFRPEICLSRFWLITRPDASSDARLIR